MVANDLAKDCQLCVPETKYIDTGGKGIFLSKRFDRNGEARIHMASAMNMLGLSDGTDQGSYLAIAEFLRQNSSNVTENLQELWHRIAFGAIINNTDDHLRNHAFLLHDEFWELSPIYDINPNQDNGLSLPIDPYGTERNLRNILEFAELFNVKRTAASDYLSFAVSTVKNRWKYYAGKYKISSAECRRMAAVFNAQTKNIL